MIFCGVKRLIHTGGVTQLIFCGVERHIHTKGITQLIFCGIDRHINRRGYIIEIPWCLCNFLLIYMIYVTLFLPGPLIM